MLLWFRNILDACPVWEKLENQRGDGAVQNEDASDETECKAACIADSGCVGFDLDTRDSTCWLHLSVDNFDPPIPNDGINLYKLVERCPDGMWTSQLLYGGNKMLSVCL